MKRVYLDNAATTPLDAKVLDVMMPYMREHFGNASSVHGYGRKARYAIEDARERVAAVLGCEPAKVIFTSGGTEADNVAVKTLAARGTIASSRAEHKAVLDPLKKEAVEWLSNNRYAAVDVETFESVSNVGGATLMYVNNETGAINDVAAFVEHGTSDNIVVHTDAVQAAGLYDISPDVTGVDMMTISAHKIGGPKGVGVLYVRAGIELHPVVSGGSQERGRRGGTENVAAIAGCAAAMEKAAREREEWFERCKSLRTRFMDVLAEEMSVEYVVNSPEGGAPHIINIAFPPVGGTPVDGEMLILNMDLEGVAVSSGSACTSGALQPSHVLLAAGLPPDTAAASLRVSIGKQNSADDMDYAVQKLVKCVTRMTAGSGIGSTADLT